MRFFANYSSQMALLHALPADQKADIQQMSLWPNAVAEAASGF
jgi:hypothetical protein